MFYLWNLLEEVAGGGTEQPKIGTYIIFGVAIVAIIGMFVWSTISNKKKRKQAEEMVTSLKIGDRVKTIGGICGFVVQVNDSENTFVLETGLDDNKSYVKFDKGAIYQTAPAQGNAVSAPAPAPVVEQPAVEEPKKKRDIEEI